MRILIVEDERRLAQFLKKGFEAESMAVDVAKDGNEGADLGREGNYDAIVLDLMLPGKDGLSVLKEIRGAGKPTPILILSARGEVEDRSQRAEPRLVIVLRAEERQDRIRQMAFQ